MKRQIAFLVLILIGVTALPALATRGGNVVYLPLIAKPLALEISKMTVTQAVQTDSNGVVLVANRPAFARVYVERLEGGTPTVTVKLTVKVGNSVRTRTKTKTIDATPNNGSLSSTVNFDIPASWLTGNALISAEIEGANTVSKSFTVRTVPDLQIKIVPIDYRHTDGILYNGRQEDRVSVFVYRTFPIDTVQISYHSDYFFEGDLLDFTGADWIDLLEQITVLKMSENAPTEQVYLAQVPIENGGASWFSRGIAGIGWIDEGSEDARIAVSLNFGRFDPGDLTGEIAAHEIGHNLGRRHAPCGGATGIDPAFPYSGARIGQYGYDIVRKELKTASGFRDLMSYCEPQWVSDYTYKALLDNQWHFGRSLSNAVEDALLIRVQVEDGSAEIGPIYRLDTATNTTRATTDYSIDLFAADGTLLGTHNVNLRLAQAEGVDATGIVAAVPAPDTAVASVAIRHNEEVLATRTVNSPVRAPLDATLTVNDGEARVTWTAATAPVMIRHIAPDGTIETLGLDVTGGAFEIGNREGVIEVISADADSIVTLQLP